MLGYARARRGRGAAARRAAGAPSAATPLPPRWDWTAVDAEQARAWSRAHGRELPPGSYATPTIDQHAHGWCGSCYLTAAVFMVQDRANLALALEPAAAVAGSRASARVARSCPMKTAAVR